MSKQLLTAFSLICVSFSAFASSAEGEVASLFSSEMLFKLINFLLLLLILHRFARKPIAKMLSNSAGNTKKKVDDVEAQLAAAKSRLVEYQTKITNLERELETRQESAIGAIELEKERIINDTKNQAQKLEEQSQNRIEQNILKAKAEIRAFLVNESVQLAEKVISEQIDSKKRKVLVENYTKSLNEIA
ncbi:MAG: ATP synthase F0 subunit B [SAR324 cluster bacterium]|nr:ATP synthase F0 subunit B [SAR324 cluster bacterium]